MPNLARLMSEGTSGKFQSVFPPITPPAWTSFTTGKNPGKHGIFHFMEAKPGSYALGYTNASSRRTQTVWKILNDAGLTTGITNIPFTYPPEHLKGYQTSGMDTPSEKSPFVYPPELREEAREGSWPCVATRHSLSGIHDQRSTSLQCARRNASNGRTMDPRGTSSPPASGPRRHDVRLHVHRYSTTLLLAVHG